MDNGKCVEDPNKFIPPNDDLCKTYVNEKCEECAERAYFDKDGKCQEVNIHCMTWDPLNGICVGCYDGYKLDDDNNCAWDEKNDAGPTDKGCKTWDWKNQVCL